VSKTTTKKVVETRMLRRAFEEHLDTLRSQWKFWKEQEELSVDHESGISPIMIYNALEVIREKGEELKGEIEGLQPFQSMSEMIRSGYDLGELELLIVDMILALRDSLSITNNITPTQAKEAAIIITEQFAGLSIEELAMCFHRGKIGEYGEIMHRLDVNVLLSWLNKFSKEMERVSIELNSQQHSQFKRVEMDGKTSDLDLLKWFKVLPKAKDANKELYAQKSLDKKADSYFGGF
tara:strand:- start:3084 stop:3791 length:708 start_codon:yes stop_codon:yes gene_type:complete